MKVVVNELESCKRGLQVEIPGERVSAEIEKTFKEYSRHARVAGFRQGHIPIDVVRQRFGKEVREEVVRRMVQEYAARALEDKKLQPVHDPVLDDVSYETGQPLVFRATFEVRPVVSVSDYHRIPVTIKRREVTEAMVEQSLAALADRAARLEAIEGRPVQKGDFVVGTLSCRFVKGKGKDLVNEPLFLEAGAESNHPDFNAAILGMQAGESKSFEVSYPDDYRAESLRGSVVSYSLVLKEIKKKVLPPIDDDLAKELGNFQTLAELRSKVRLEIEGRARASEAAESKDKILQNLVERHTFDVPGTMVEAQIDSRLEGIVREMMAQGIDPTKATVNWQEEREKLRTAAGASVRALLILEAIAVQEGIEATDDEVNGWLWEEARRQNTSVSALKERLAANARLTGVRRQIVREKVLDFLMNDATITPEGT